MSVIFAHHIELHHYPILVCVFAAGFYVGWQLVARMLTRTPPTTQQERK